MSTLFLSDLHLEDGRPETLSILREFLSGPAAGADAIYILGDLFEYWIGDDALSGMAQELARNTHSLTEKGLPIYFMHGNRDFLLGEKYAALSGMKILPESVTVDLYGTPTLLLHGDALCTDDLAYQAFRLQSRNPAWQAAVLARSVEERLAMAKSARDTSQDHTGSASMQIMDVNAGAVKQAFIENGVMRMIHGHTHRPDVHEYDMGSAGTARRYVLADWYTAGSFLEVSAAGVSARKI